MPTARQQQVIDAIVALTEKEGFPPTTRELADHLGVWHSAAHRTLLRLREEGLVSWEDGRARTLVVVNQPSTSPTTPDQSA